jgi:hypothetical protein
MIRRSPLVLALSLVALAASRAPAQIAEAALDDAVRSYDSRMELAAEPGPQVADFDGDGSVDVVAVLEGGGKTALVIFNRTASGYVPHALYASLPHSEYRVRVVPPGRYRIVGAEGTVQTKSSAVELVFPGRSSAMYVWGGSRYQVYATENY